ncbi:MAG: EF-P lysine aminoacylase GenX [Pirellulales bacterium]|nr:EF-P lysine aminoacylase GenX [Pirellulales bacterium]
MRDEKPPSNFRPTASWENLALRAELLRKVRAFFDGRGFLEVETPILSADTVVDRHLDPFVLSPLPANLRSVPGEGPGVRAEQGSCTPQPLTASPHPNPLPKGEGTLFLQTSPEFAMKRLLAAGGSAIYQVAKVFRQGEFGPLHNPEFTMVEWYRVGDSMAEGIQLTSDLCEALLSRGPADRVSYRQVFERHVGVDPLTAEAAELQAAAARWNLEVPEGLGDDRDGWLDLLLVERVQPRLGLGRPTIVYDYPASQAALSRVRPENPPVAERFELYVDGIELANGYHELVDAAELRRRNREVNARRRADGKIALPEHSRLLAAMDFGLPPCTGVALGFDRVVMVAAGAKSLAEVIAFPFDRA